MKKIIKIIIGASILLLFMGVICAEDPGFKDTTGVAEDFNELWISGKKVANITSYNDSDCIDKEILSKDDQAIIKHVTKSNVEEVSSVDNPKDVYEFLTNEGMFYTFGKDDHIYIVTIDESQWNVDMLDKMDEWCLENSN